MRVLLACLIALGGCRSSATTTKAAPPIEVLSATNDVLLRVETDDHSSELSIAKPRYDGIIGGDKLVLRAPNAKLRIDYPLHKPAVFDVPPDQPNGAYSLRGVVRAIAVRYAEVYRVEEQTTSTPVGKVPGLENRNETNGKYGIWGHDLEDLVLETIIIKLDATGQATIGIEVGS